MLLRHVMEIMVNAPPEYCARCVADPEAFLFNSRYTYTVRRLKGRVYEVVFRWVKLGMERFYRVVLRVDEGEGRVVYESTPDSPHEFRMMFSFRGEDGSTRVRVEAEMGAGALAALLGRRDYRRFIEELVEKGIVASATRLSAREPGPEGPGSEARCENCILYDSARGYCYALGSHVDPSKPQCGGRYYLPRWAAREATG